MGATYLCKCSNCDLTAEVCNGSSGGFEFECTTVWCDDCTQLSDTTTSALRDTSFIKPPEIRCNVCAQGDLVQFDIRKCPRCGTKLVMDNDKDGDGKTIIVDRCETCSFATPYAFSARVNEDDMVSMSMVCETCYSVSIERFTENGAWNRYKSYTHYELSCGRCESKSVSKWNNSMPCPKCGDHVRVSKHPVEFFD